MNCPHRQGMTRTREQRIYRTTILGSIVNVILLAGKFAAGILGHSAAMIADAVHSLSDFLTDIVVIVLVRFSSKPADNNHPYGHGKYDDGHFHHRHNISGGWNLVGLEWHSEDHPFHAGCASTVTGNNCPDCSHSEYRTERVGFPRHKESSR